MKPYPIQLEISGPTALWTRPDTGSSPVSYVAPTFSAVKGIFESVLRWKSVNVRPTKVEICALVQFHRYTTNYGGPLRASDALPSPPRPGRGLGEVSRFGFRNFGSPAEPKPLPGGEGWFRPETRICEAGNCKLPVMLKPIFLQPKEKADRTYARSAFLLIAGQPIFQSAPWFGERVIAKHKHSNFAIDKLQQDSNYIAIGWPAVQKMKENVSL